MAPAAAPDPVEGRGGLRGEVVNLDAVRKRRGSREAEKSLAAAAGEPRAGPIREPVTEKFKPGERATTRQVLT